HLANPFRDRLKLLREHQDIGTLHCWCGSGIRPRIHLWIYILQSPQPTPLAIQSTQYQWIYQSSKSPNLGYRRSYLLVFEQNDWFVVGVVFAKIVRILSVPIPNLGQYTRRDPPQHFPFL